MPALYPKKTGPAPDAAKREQVTGRIRRRLGEDRTWTAGQLADAVHPHGIRVGPRQVRRYPRLLKAGHRRTASTLEHEQDAEEVRRAERVLGGPAAKAAAGRLRLFYLDECGFSPSLPTGYSWRLPGHRKRVKYEYPQGRRVNARAAYEPFGPAPGLAKAGIHLYDLPAYSPELNRIEAVFKQVKHHEMPTRSHTSKAELRASVEQGFDSYRRKLRTKGEGQPRLAA